MLKKNLLDITDLKINEQAELYNLASNREKLFQKYAHSLNGKIMASLFFQPSTRTQFSFQSAFLKLGGQCLTCTDINHTRSGAPYYESLRDMGIIISNYCDIVVMRTIDDSQTLELVKGLNIPMISGGSGNIAHPTQALTDLFTLKNNFGCLTDHNILIIGTPRQRTINSFIKGISMWGKNHFHILCQEGIQLSTDVCASLNNSTVKYYHSWEEVYDSEILKQISIIYIDKIFYETHVHYQFVINEQKLQAAISPDAVILHPLPRTAEMPYFMDTFKGASYFQQAKNGLYVRAALFLEYLAL